MCNVLVCMAVWMTLAGRSVVDKAVAIVLPISAFVAAGFEHSVANMYFIPLGMMLQAGLSLITAKLAIIGLLAFFISPTATHALVKAAMTRGIKPLLGPQRRAPSKP